MSAGVVTVNKEGVTIALNRLQLNLQRREEMYADMGARMLTSIRRTFREQGSPAGSWVPLAPSTVARDPKKYGAGHKLLIDSGVLLNSITYQVTSGGVYIGTSVKYAAVHNFGSRDRGTVAVGPRTKEMHDAKAKVQPHWRTVKIAPKYEMREFTRADGSKGRVPMKVYKQTVKMQDKNGRTRTVTRTIPDLGVTKTSRVKGHGRHQNIPARPFMVFRPEDPAALNQIAGQFLRKAAADAKLGGAA